MTGAKVKYDPQTDILRIRLGEKPIEESDQVEPGVIVDYDAEGHVVGVELLDASEWLSRTPVPDSTSLTANKE